MKLKFSLLKTSFFVLIFILNFACKDQVKTSTTDTKDTTALAYQCPMDCEDGKTYSENVPCPVCKMALKKQEATNSKKSTKHSCNHDDDCKKDDCKKEGCKHHSCSKCKKEANCSCADKKECKCEEKCKCEKCPEHA